MMVALSEYVTHYNSALCLSNYKKTDSSQGTQIGQMNTLTAQVNIVVELGMRRASIYELEINFCHAHV